MYRNLAILLTTLLVAACGSPSPDTATRDRYRVAVAAESSPSDASAANWQRFVDNVKVWAPQFTVTLQGPDAAGPPAGWAAAAQAGALQVAALPPEAARVLVPELAVLGLPGLFASQAEADHVLDQAVFESFRQLFLARNLALLEWYDDDWTDPASRAEYGTGVIVANKAWFDRLTPHDRDVFAHAYGSAGQARADRRAAVGSGEPAAHAAAALDEATRATHAARIAEIGGAAAQLYAQVLQGKAAFATGLASSGAAPDRP